METLDGVSLQGEGVLVSRPGARYVASPGPDPAQQREDRPHDRALGQPLILGELERLAAERLGLVGPALIVRDKAEQRERPDHGGTDRRGPADADRLLHRGLGLHLLAGEVEAVAERPRRGLAPEAGRIWLQCEHPARGVQFTPRPWNP